jgi:hypothetical protein
MDKTNIVVDDKEEIKVFIINNIDMRVTGLNLGSSVSVNVILKNNDTFINSVNFDISGQEYEDWGSDDTYLENLILQKLGLTRKPEPQPEPTL